MELRIDKDGYLTGCSGVGKELRLPPEVRGISGIFSSAFEGCDALERLILPPTVEWVERCALSGAVNLKELIIEGTQTGLEDHSCWRDKLEHIVFSPENHEIENSAFWGSKWLKDQPFSAWIRDGELLCYDGDHTEFEIPPEVTAIGDNAFFALRELPLTAIHIGKQVERIGHAAFHSCGNLSAVYFGGAPLIEPDAFDGTPWLQSRNGFLINHGRLMRYIGNAERVVVPDGVSEVCAHAFEMNEQIRSVFLPQSVTEMGRSAFSGCVNLRDVTLSQSPREITWNVFAFCESLEELSLPESVRVIGRCAFAGCKKLARIIRPNRYIRFDSGAFYHCDALYRHAEEYGIPPEAFELKPVRLHDR